MPLSILHRRQLRSEASTLPTRGGWVDWGSLSSGGIQYIKQQDLCARFLRVHRLIYEQRITEFTLPLFYLTTNRLTNQSGSVAMHPSISNYVSMLFNATDIR